MEEKLKIMMIIFGKKKRYDIMLEALRLKFTQNEDIKKIN